MHNDRERLVNWMKANGHDVRSLAEKTGDTRTSVLQMVNGTRTVNSAFKWRLRRAFGNAVADQLFPDEAPQVETA